MTRAVVIRPLARRDIRESFDWIEACISTESALNWEVGIDARIESLLHTPEVWPEADESYGLDFKLQMILFRRGRQVHRILYEIEGEKVIVHRVRHAAQDTLTADDF